MKIGICLESPKNATVDVVVICAPPSPLKDPLVREMDQASGGVLKQLVQDQEFKGKAGQVVFLPAPKGMHAKYMLLVGSGGEKGQTAALVRDLAALGVQRASKLRARSVAIFLPAAGKEADRAAQQAAIGAHLAAYTFAQYRTQKKPSALKQVVFSFERAKARIPAARKRLVKPAMGRGEAIAEAVCVARDLVNQPPAAMTPAKLATEARRIARKRGLTAKVLGKKECERLGMGMLLAVGQGSVAEVKLIHLTYKPKTKPLKRVALIGKGITFDSGGYSLKPSSGMLDMKIDMAGAAAVIAAMGALARVGCKYEVHGIAPCAENLVSGNAYKLGDVLRAMDGSTVEVTNTDAEGRLALGDAITYARKVVKPDEMLDFATLTGACMVALGPSTAAVMSDHSTIAKKFLTAGEKAGEDLWRLPLNPALKGQLKSRIADMRNSGERWGGAITAGLFLKHFAKDTPWIHVDIAGPASTNRALGPAIQPGGTGFAVASILEYLRQ